MPAKYDKIGKDYNLTRRADPVLTQNLLRHLHPNPEGIYLDIGCGTGNYTIALQQKGFRFVGLDPSVRMLEEARAKNQSIDWRLGTAEDTGLPRNYFDGVIASLTIHHWSDLEKGFKELFAVLKPAGRIVLFTSTPRQMQGYWLHHYFPKMLAESMTQMPTQQKVIAAMTEAGFQQIKLEPYFIHPELEDKFLYGGKHDPTFYFDETIRNGISSFSSLSNQAEVAAGLTHLKREIENGEIKEVMKSYKNDEGDYLYISGEKQADEWI